MTRSPITLCLYASTLGHFGRHVYRQTVDNLLAQAPRESWGGMIAHIKVRPVDEERARVGEMTEWLAARGFRVLVTEGQWAHFSDSHSIGYIADTRRVLAEVTTPYVAHWEDDWEVACYQHDLEYWLHEAVKTLEVQPALVQVRIARFTNEAQRILGLRAKHGIDAHSEVPTESDKLFRHSDFSANPCIVRTRDLRAALAFLVAAQGLPQHIEHGTAITLKLISGDPLPFACFNASMIRVGHLGVRTPEEADDLDKPLLAT